LPIKIIVFSSVYIDKDEIKQRIVLGPLIWGIQFDDIKLKLEKFGVKKMKKGESATPELSGSKKKESKYPPAKPGALVLQGL